MKTTVAAVGTRVGAAIARDVLAEDLPRAWTGLDSQDGDQLIAAGILPGTPEWDEVEASAEAEYRRLVVGAWCHVSPTTSWTDCSRAT